MVSFLKAFVTVLTRPFWCSFSGIYQTILLKRYLSRSDKASTKTGRT